MKVHPQTGLLDVQRVYSGAEGNLWELIMGRQIHIGGFRSSMELAERAGIAKGMSGVDLCCCSGAGMQFLVRFCGVATMHGVDATEYVIDRGRQRCREEQMDAHIRFTLADACQTTLPAGEADFVWSEDAWCYVTDKPRLLGEAARLVRQGGVVAFTDWVEGEGLSDQQAERFMQFMKFPTLFSIEDYARGLTSCGCDITHAYDTGRFASHAKLYIDMVDKQLTSDALRLVGWDMNILASLAEELQFVLELAESGRIAQALFVARKTLKPSERT